MVKPKHDPRREHRIEMEIVVDAYGDQERVLGWYYYLQATIRFPFTATCIAKRPTSPLNMNDEVMVIGMPSEDVCEHEMFVKIRWEKKALAVPLSQLHPAAAVDKRTRQAVGDWHYWVKMWGINFDFRMVPDTILPVTPFYQPLNSTVELHVPN